MGKLAIFNLKNHVRDSLIGDTAQYDNRMFEATPKHVSSLNARVPQFGRIYEGSGYAPKTPRKTPNVFKSLGRAVSALRNIGEYNENLTR